MTERYRRTVPWVPAPRPRTSTTAVSISIKSHNARGSQFQFAFLPRSEHCQQQRSVSRWICTWWDICVVELIPASTWTKYAGPSTVFKIKVWSGKQPLPNFYRIWIFQPKQIMLFITVHVTSGLCQHALCQHAPCDDYRADGKHRWRVRRMEIGVTFHFHVYFCYGSRGRIK